MKIKVVPRKFFLDIKGTEEEEKIINDWNIISICTPAYPPKGFEEETVPFSDYDRSNILVLWFHDTDYQADDHVVLFDENMALQILDFIERTIGDGKGYIVHCTAGFSRSQAVGMVLNDVINKLILHDHCDYEQFEQENQNKRRPNSLVKKLLLNVFENNFNALEKSWTRLSSKSRDLPIQEAQII